MKPGRLLEYSRQGRASTWPVGWYVCALVWAFVGMSLYAAMTTAYREKFLASLRTQLALLACAAVRLVWARCWREQGRGWEFYVALLVLAPVVWALVSPVLARLGRILWGGPVIP